MVTEALVDSGATMSVFDASLAEMLGIHDLEEGEAIGFEGVSGHSIVGYLHEVTLELGGVRLPPIGVAFSRDFPDRAVNILGQQGFFEMCPIKFTYRRKEIAIVTSGMLRTGPDGGRAPTG